MYQQWSKLGRPTWSHLANVDQQLRGTRLQMLEAITTGMLVASLAIGFHIHGMLPLAVLVGCGLVWLFAVTSPIGGFVILRCIDRDYGPGSAARVVAWLRHAPDGETIDLDAVVGHPPMR